MPKIGMESLYQGYLQNLEAEKSKKTRRPTATQYTDKQPNERNDFDRFCAVIEIMRKALGPNVPFGNDNFIRGYYEISKKRKHEIGEAEFTSVFGDPNDKRIKACLDGVNKTRGISGRVSNRDYVDLKNYGADRLTGKAKLGSDVLKDINKELVAQAKLAKKRDAAAREANARLKHLQLKKLYLKALVAPNGVVDPKSLDAQTAELGRNTALNNALAAAAKDPKMQDRIMAAEVNKLRGRRERNEFYEKAPEAPRRKNEDPQRGGPKLGG